MCKIFKQLFLKFFVIIYILYSINCKNFASSNEVVDENKNNLKIRKLDNNKRNLLIGSIFKYDWETIKLFFVSLIKTDFQNCDFVMFVGAMDQDVIKKINLCGVITYPIPDELLNSQYEVNAYRWKLFEDFLLENKNKYNMVFHTDVRDSIFQKDIFQYFDYTKPFLGVFLEDGNLTEEVNRKWIMELIDDNEYNKIKNERIICSGSLIGTTNEFLELAHAEWQTVKSRNDFLCDQGILDYLIYCKKFLNDYIIKNDNYGPLMTLGTTFKRLFLDKDDNIVNYKGEIAAVAHQYDKDRLMILEGIKKKFDDNFDIDDYMIKRGKSNNKNITDNTNHIENMNNTNTNDNSSKINVIFIVVSITITVIIIYCIYLFVKKKNNISLNKNIFQKVRFNNLKYGKNGKIKFYKLNKKKFKKIKYLN